MDLPVPPPTLAALAALVRDRLAEVGGSVGGAVGVSLRRGAELPVMLPVITRLAPERAVVASARVATVLIAAAAPFAPTSHARMRLIRQMHASGLLSGDEASRAGEVLVASGGSAARPC